ncbi:MAG: cytochrome c oxidase assembly protein [Gammaproteobacteria bacterium]|nr:cytochrome c oxidase assembly protein [Gammaproteobacteria bacterium]
MAFLQWWIPWEPSATVVVVFAAAVWLYARGVWRSPLSAPWRRQLLFWAGMLILYTGLHTRLDYYAEHEFFIHRIQHVGLHHLGPFLIALAYPGVTMRRGLPLNWRLRLRVGVRWTPVRWLFNVLLHPLVAAVLFVGLIYLWLWPAVHFDAMLDWRLYHVMNYSMAADGMLFWWLILDRRTRPPARLSPGMRVFLALAVIVPQIVLGAYLSLTRSDLYPIYSLCGRAFAGISPLQDQHLGGLILWVPSSMMSVLAALIAFSHWLRLDGKGRLPKRKAQRADWRARVVAQTQGPEALAGRTGKSA